jgi:glycosyltransferase involved in cell wall biosynthesis
MPPTDRPPLVLSPADLPGPSGGTVYNTRLAREWGTEPVPVAGAWPHPDAADLAQLEQVLHAHAGDRPLLVDGIIGCAAPEAVARVSAHAAVWLLVHLPLPADAASTEAPRLARSEGAALHAATGVVVTSGWAERDVRRRYGDLPLLVAEPGTDPSPPSRGSEPPRLFTPAAYTVRKNHALLLQALTAVQDLSWTAHWVGTGPDRGTGPALRAGIDAGHLAGRVRMDGPATGTSMERAWDAADLLLLPSTSETYAMVVAEALSHGIPALVSAGTAAAETLVGTDGDDPAGAALDPQLPQEWAATLRRWLEDTALRRHWSTRARSRGRQLPTWADTAHTVHTHLSQEQR